MHGAQERTRLLAGAEAVLAHPGSEDERRDAFPEFYEENPRLFGIICSGRCDLRTLEMMLSMIGDVEAGTMNVSDASGIVANSLNLTYIESVLPPPTPEQAVAPGQDTKVTLDAQPCLKRPRT